MAHLWAWFTAAVWPNLVASLLSLPPALLWHHMRIRRRLDAIHRHVAAAPDATGGGIDPRNDHQPAEQEGTAPCVSS